jgi:hypothetical protein
MILFKEGDIVSKYNAKQRIYTKKWDDAHIEHIGVVVPKGFKDRIRVVTDGGSISAFCRNAVEAALNAAEEKKNRQG